MKVAVLPFNPLEGTSPALGRQFAGFASEQLKVHAEADTNTVNYLTQIQDPDGSMRTAFVNLPDSLLPDQQLEEFFEHSGVELIMDGNLKQTGDDFEMTVRFHKKDVPGPLSVDVIQFSVDDLFKQLHGLVKILAAKAEVELPPFLAGEMMSFGTENPRSYLGFLEGLDAINHIQQANGMVPREFSPQPAIEALLASFQADPSFQGSYHILAQMARACAHYRLAPLQPLDGVLQELIRLAPTQALAYYALGEVHQAFNSLTSAADYYEKAITLEGNDPVIYSRLGAVQFQMGMPINAERNLRKAFALEGEEKPSGDLLATVLIQTGRSHEVPILWKGVTDAYPQNAAAHARYAMALLQVGREPDAERAFEFALEMLEDNTLIKRWYAPWLSQKGDVDRAMDFYEDVLDVTPNDISVLTQYAGTLDAAGRDFEIPQVMKTILASNPDPNTRAEARARLIELEQPKRVQNVQAAREKMEAQDFAGAITNLKPLRNWLADYWKLWLLLASAYNQTEQFVEAEEAAQRLLEIYPGFEPGFGELVKAMHGQGKVDEAYRLMQLAATHNPNSLPIHINLALAAKRAGQADEARQLAKRIRESIGPNAELEPVLAEIER